MSGIHILSIEQLEWVVKEGMNFGVSPACDEDLWVNRLALQIPYYPGVLTPTELRRTMHAGCLYPTIFPLNREEVPLI